MIRAVRVVAPGSFRSVVRPLTLCNLVVCLGTAAWAWAWVGVGGRGSRGSVGGRERSGMDPVAVGVQHTSRACSQRGTPEATSYASSIQHWSADIYGKP